MGNANPASIRVPHGSSHGPPSRAERTQLATAFDAGMQQATVAHDRLPGYRVLGEIHRGGQGVVYKAVQHGTQRTVAIKVMHQGPFAGPRDKARFEREVRLLAQLDHPNIVTILESGTAEGSFFHGMDYVAGSIRPVSCPAAAGR